MYVNPMLSYGAATGASTTGNPATEANDMFMKLLMAQLKSQSPLDPVDPNQFVGQLVQFNSLDQLIQIREALDTLNGTINPSAATSTHGAK